MGVGAGGGGGGFIIDPPAPPLPPTLPVSRDVFKGGGGVDSDNDTDGKHRYHQKSSLCDDDHDNNDNYNDNDDNNDDRNDAYDDNYVASLE